MLEYNYDNILERRINYEDFRDVDYVIVSDKFASIPSVYVDNEHGSDDNGMGQSLMIKVGYTKVTDIVYNAGVWSDLHSQLGILHTKNHDWDNTTLHVFVSMLSERKVLIPPTEDNFNCWLAVLRRLKGFKLRPYVTFN